MTLLSEVERPLALFAQAISNRIPIFRSDEPGHAIGSANQGEFFLPNEFSYFDDSRANCDVYRWTVMQQLAFLRFSTLSFDIQLARSQIEFLADQALPIAHRAPDLELFYNHFPIPEFANYLFYVLEETRVGNLIISEFPGAKRLRCKSRDYRLATTLVPTQAPYEDIVELELSLQVPDAMSPQRRSLVAPIFERSADVYASAQATVNCYLAFCANVAREFDRDDLSSLNETIELPTLQRVARLEDWQKELNDIDAALLAMEFDADHVEATQSESQEALDGSVREAGVDLKQERDQLQRRVDMERSMLSNYRMGMDLGGARYRYDEWDYLNQSWLKAWCSVFEIRAEHPQQESVSKLLKRIQPVIAAVRKRFEQLKPTGMRRIPRSLDGAELDLNAVVEARADVKAGLAPTEHVYSRIARKHRDVSACLLVDLSASTDDPAVKPEREPLPEDIEDPFDDPHLHGAIDFDPEQTESETPRKIIDIQKESVLLLSTALEDLGDLYSVYGFSGYGRDGVEIYIAKEFKESLNRRTVNAIAAMKPLRSTRMGPAIRHATHKLLSTGSSLKVLMVISDGFPQDYDYGPDRGDHEYGIQDTSKAILEAHDKGVQVFCVTVDVSGHDYLRRMCRADQYWVIEDTEELPKALQFAYRRLTS